MRSKEFVSTLSEPVLQNTLRNQRQPSQRSRYEPTVVYYLAEQAKANGVELDQAEGPWRAGARALSRPGRNSLHNIPVVTNEHTEVMVDTASMHPTSLGCSTGAASTSSNRSRSSLRLGL